MSEVLPRLSRSGTHFRGTQQDLKSLRGRFDRKHCIPLKGLLDPELRPVLLALLEQAEFRPNHYRQVGAELEAASAMGWRQ